MLIFMMLLCALMVMMLLIQFMSYGRYVRKVLSADTSLSEVCDSSVQTLSCN